MVLALLLCRCREVSSRGDGRQVLLGARLLELEAVRGLDRTLTESAPLLLVGRAGREHNEQGLVGLRLGGGELAGVQLCFHQVFTCSGSRLPWLDTRALGWEGGQADLLQVWAGSGVWGVGACSDPVPAALPVQGGLVQGRGAPSAHRGSFLGLGGAQGLDRLPRCRKDTAAFLLLRAKGRGHSRPGRR